MDADAASRARSPTAADLGLEPRSASRVRSAVAAAVLLLAGAGAWWAWRSLDPPPPLRYRAEPARRGDLVVTVSATGRLQPRKQVEVGTEVSGVIAKVEVDFNDPVTRTQVLARLDTEQLEAAVLQAKAEVLATRAAVRATQASVTEAERELARARSLFQGRIATDHDLDVAVAAHERAAAEQAAAEARVARAEAALAAEETRLRKAVIRSPIDGVVLSRAVEPGQTVAASFQTPVLFVLAEDLRQMDVVLDIDEADMGVVAEKQRATFSVDAYPERAFPAELVELRSAPKTIDGVVTYEAVLRVDNPDLLLRPGMTVTAMLTVDEAKDALLVPQAALRFTPPPAEAPEEARGVLGSLFPRPPHGATRAPAAASTSGPKRVWALERDGSLREVPVEVGPTDGRMTVIRKGDIAPGLALAVEALTGEP